ncbi:MAG: hypothetical protein IPG77_10015 [Betaproteobacteria bacterium]|nr:hypothetical protein [Betaproteobacteria bacterium]
MSTDTTDLTPSEGQDPSVPSLQAVLVDKARLEEVATARVIMPNRTQIELVRWTWSPAARRARPLGV